MYCVIQEIPTKKPDRGGYGKELKASYMQITIGDGKDVLLKIEFFSCTPPPDVLY